MGKIKSKRVPDNNVGEFTETVDYHVMHQANFEKNANKFFCLELQKSPDGRHRIFTHYGRLGITNVYEVRDEIDGEPIYDESVAYKEFESIHKKKLRGKRDKNSGELLHYVDIDTVAPTVGSENIRDKSSVVKKVQVKRGSNFDTSSFNPKVAKLIDQFVKENIHNVTTNTSIKYTSNGYMTELGPVTSEHCSRAREPLNELNEMLKKNDDLDPDNKKVQKLNSAFFSLIPKPFSRKIAAEDLILDAKKLQDEYDILEQLETAVSMGSAMQGNTAQRMEALGTDIEFLSDKEEVRRIKKYIRESRAHNHRGSSVWNYDVRSIYKIRIPNERARYNKTVKKYGNVKEVFHGSANSNLLSILMSGLIVPRASASHVTGRMFGAGLYGALQSTKSLNYSIGFWGARSSHYNNAFLFLADFAMGKIYTAKSAIGRGAPKGYDSIWAKKGYSLYNDELIVYSLKQCTLKYLVEMTVR